MCMQSADDGPCCGMDCPEGQAHSGYVEDYPLEFLEAATSTEDSFDFLWPT